jgi:hypothetical protein
MTLVVYVVAGSTAGLLLGSLLGLGGGLLDGAVRAAIATIVSLAAIALGSLQLLGRGTGLLQCDRETPKVWVDRGALGWAIRNGAALGCGATSRIGFWAWYLVPVGAFLSGSPWVGAIVYGSYGFIRTFSAWPILVAVRRRSQERVGARLLRAGWLARRVAAAQLVFVGVLVFVSVGV